MEIEILKVFARRHMQGMKNLYVCICDICTCFGHGSKDFGICKFEDFPRCLC